MLRRIAIGLVLALLMALPATAQDFLKGAEAYSRGDYATALKEWRPLAARGNTDAQSNLGLMYAKGQGVPKDFSQAANWYRKAAAQGDARAQFTLGFMYAKGQGVPKNLARAVKWYRRAAELGNVPAQFALGFMYAQGLGVTKDIVFGYMWFSLAAAKGYKNGAEVRDVTAKSMTPAQIAKAQKLAREWLAKHPKKK